MKVLFFAIAVLVGCTPPRQILVEKMTIPTLLGVADVILGLRQARDGVILLNARQCDQGEKKDLGRFPYSTSPFAIESGELKARPMKNWVEARQVEQIYFVGEPEDSPRTWLVGGKPLTFEINSGGGLVAHWDNQNVVVVFRTEHSETYSYFGEKEIQISVFLLDGRAVALVPYNTATGQAVAVVKIGVK